MGYLLINWWWGKRESASLTSWFQPVWDLHACGQHTIHFSYLVGISVSAKWLKNIMCIPWWRTKTLTQGWAIAPPLSLHPPFPSYQQFEPARWNSGKVMEAEWSPLPVIKKWGTQNRFCVREPHRVLLGVTSISSWSHNSEINSFLWGTHFYSYCQSCLSLEDTDCGRKAICIANTHTPRDVDSWTNPHRILAVCPFSPPVFTHKIQVRPL